jgi:basic amino acid/polyamine antiporter, APA family
MPVVPILGMLANFALMYSLGKANWLRLLVWLAIGQVIYFAYGLRYSRLRKDSRL